MKLTDWSPGKPPMIGEWNASTVRDEKTFRWWDGESWSYPYSRSISPQAQRHFRRKKESAHMARFIEWRGLAKKPKNFVPPQPLEP